MMLPYGSPLGMNRAPPFNRGDAMEQPARQWELTVRVSWQRVVAGLLVVLGLLVLGFGVVRPMVSVFIGRQVSRELNEALAREVLVALVGPVDGPQNSAVPAGAAGAASAPEGTNAADVTGQQGGAPAPIASNTTNEANVPAPSSAVTTSGQDPQAGAQVRPAPVSSRGLLRTIAEGQQPTADPAAAGILAQPQQEAAVAPAATSAPAAAVPFAPGAPPAVVPTVVIAPPISSPDQPRSAEEIVKALPNGAITVAEDKVNEKIAARAAALGPIDRILVRFVPGQVQVTLTVLGQDTVATAGLGLDNGRVVAQNPQLSGALAMAISVGDLVQPVEDELNQIVAEAGRQVRDVEIQQGQIVVTMD